MPGPVDMKPPAVVQPAQRPPPSTPKRVRTPRPDAAAKAARDAQRAAIVQEIRERGGQVPGEESFPAEEARVQAYLESLRAERAARKAGKR